MLNYVVSFPTSQAAARCRRLACILAIAAPVAASGQATQATPAPAAARRDFTRADLDAWKSVRDAQLSNDGRWFAYQLAPNEGDAEVVLRSVDRAGGETHIAIGEAPAARPGPAGLTAVEFSGDGKWLAVTVFPTHAEAEKARRTHKPAHNSLVIVNTATGAQRRFDQVRRFTFAGERPEYIALSSYPAETPPVTPPASSGAPRSSGLPGGTPAPPPSTRVEPSDLLIYQLGTQNVLTIGSVADFSADHSGHWLAYTIEGHDPQGNGVQVRDLRTGTVRVLDSQRALYRRLAWSDTLPQLAVLRGTVDSVASDTAYAVLGFLGFDSRDAHKDSVRETTVALAGRGDAPAGMRVSPDRTPRWTEQGDGLLFGLREKSPAVSHDSVPDDDRAHLIVWNWQDPRLQSEQIVQAQADRTASYAAAYWPSTNKLVALGDSTLKDVTMLPHDRWAWGVDGRADERRGNLEGLPRVDYYVVDPHTGVRREAVKNVRRGQTLASPDGRSVLYFEDGDFHVLDAATLATRNITAGAPVAFWDTEDDHNVVKPETRPIGWARDNSAVLLSDNWDVWKVPVAGGAPVNLTRTGRAEKIRYQRRIVIDPREEGIDLHQPLYMSMYGERTKRGGLARIDAMHGGATTVLFDDAAFAPRRARDADVWVTTRSKFTEPPDFWVLDKDHLTTRLTDMASQLAPFKWSSGVRIVDYVSAKGDSLQGTLYLPADYQPGRKYPTITYIYEKLTQNTHNFVAPSEVNGVQIHAGIFTSRGYAVFEPDIKYRVNDPGMSTVWCVIPAVNAAIATGIVDSAHMGMQGHSWGGYQTAFMVTQTNLFHAAVAGAPLTDMVSMYSSIYWNSGGADQAIFQSSQGRFKGNFLSNWDAYERNSPNRYADHVTTPLLMLQNDRDGAVDFNQGITFFNTLRQLNKPVILLEYPGENHGLAQRGNLKDYQQRLTEWFDTYLRGAPAPEWIARGIPYLDIDAHLRERELKAGMGRGTTKSRGSTSAGEASTR